MASYTKNPAWSMEYEQGMLVLAAGGDKLFAVEDVASEVAEELLAQWRSAKLEPASLSAGAKDVFEQLVTAEIILNAVDQHPRYKLAVVFVGEAHAELKDQLKRQLPERLELTADHQAADLLVYIRTTGHLRDLVVEPYASVTTPHLLVDTAFEHSVSLGPLVFRGDTACLGCFVGRVTTYWGDARPPEAPAVLERPTLIAGLVALEAEKILVQVDRSLINTTVAYDFEERKVHKHKVYKLPQCPLCSTSTMDVAGAIDLPWFKQAKAK